MGSASPVDLVRANATFRRFLASRVVSLVGDAIVPSAIVLALAARGEGAGWVGAALAAALVPKVIFLVVGGELADRFVKIRLIVATSVVCGMAQIGSAIVLLAGAGVGWIVVLQAVYGVMVALSFPATFAYLPLCVDDADLPTANGILGAVTAIASIAGPLLTAGFIAWGGRAEPGLILDGVTFLLAAALLVGLPSPAPASGRAARLDLLAGFSELVRQPWLLRITLADGLILMLVAAPFIVLGPVVLHDRGDGGWPFVLLAFAVGELLGSVVGVRLRSAHALRVVAVGLVFMAPPPLLLALDAPLTTLTAAQVLAGLGVGAYGVVVTSTVQRSTDPALLARVGAICSMTSFAMLPIGYALAPVLAALVGMSPLLLAATVAAAVLGSLVVADPYVRGHTLSPTPR